MAATPALKIVRPKDRRSIAVSSIRGTNVLVSQLRKAAVKPCSPALAGLSRHPQKKPHPNLSQTGWDVAKTPKTKDEQNRIYSRNCSSRLSSEIELQSKLHPSRIVNRSQDLPQIGIVNVPD